MNRLEQLPAIANEMLGGLHAGSALKERVYVAAKEQAVRHLHFVLCEAEYQTLCKNAKRCGLSRSAYLRRLILKTPVKACQAVEIRALYAEINKIGSNINQIARSVNAGIASPQTAEQSLFLLQKVYDLMFRLANQ